MKVSAGRSPEQSGSGSISAGGAKGRGGMTGGGGVGRAGSKRSRSNAMEVDGEGPTEGEEADGDIESEEDGSVVEEDPTHTSTTDGDREMEGGEEPSIARSKPGEDPRSAVKVEMEIETEEVAGLLRAL